MVLLGLTKYKSNHPWDGLFYGPARTNKIQDLTNDGIEDTCYSCLMSVEFLYG